MTIVTEINNVKTTCLLSQLLSRSSNCCMLQLLLDDTLLKCVATEFVNCCL